MAGYSDTPLPKKLGIKDGARLAGVNAPPDLDAILGELPAGAAFVAPGDADIDVALLFAVATPELEREFVRLARRLKKNGGLWVAWPKRASGIPTELNENLIREFGLAAGLVDNKVCAIDETWSGLRFVYRVRDR